MDSMDSRRPVRPLDERGGQAGGDADEWPRDDVAGGPRRPAELLDQLRLRLERLADNHPSSPREPAHGRERAEGRRLDVPADRDRRAGVGDSPDGTDDPGNRHESAGEDEPGERGDPGDARGQADGRPRPDADDEQASAGAGEERWLGEGMDNVGLAESGWPAGPLGLEGDAAQAYLPWFVSSEDGAPWFAAEP